MEKLLEDVLFEAPDMPATRVLVDAARVRAQLEEIRRDEDLSRYIL